VVLPSRFRIDHLPGGIEPGDGTWFAAVRAPEGMTVLREVSSVPSSDEEHWVGLYGDDPHGLDVPGMLASVVAPLGAASVPVFVVSTFHSDLVLVPVERFDEATNVLRAAGHEVVIVD
jgi:uncharacterized protein